MTSTCPFFNTFARKNIKYQELLSNFIMISSTKNVSIHNLVSSLNFPDTLLFEDKLAIIHSHQNNSLQNKKTGLQHIQLDTISFLLVQEGSIKVIIDFTPYTIEKNMILLSTSFHIISEFIPSEDCKAIQLLIEPEFARSSLGLEKPPLSESFNLKQNPVFKLQEEDIITLTGYIEELKNIIRKNEHPYQLQIIKNILSNFILETWYYASDRSQKNQNIKLTPHEKLVINYMILLFKNIREEREVSFYASELCVSPVYLSRVAKEITGKTAIKLIAEVILAETKTLLQQPNTQIQEIAALYNFSDQASFSKFFKKHTGISPMTYKQSVISP